MYEIGHSLDHAINLGGWKGVGVRFGIDRIVQGVDRNIDGEPWKSTNGDPRRIEPLATSNVARTNGQEHVSIVRQWRTVGRPVLFNLPREEGTAGKRAASEDTLHIADAGCSRAHVRVYQGE